VDKKIIDNIYSDFYKHYNLDTSIEFQKIYRERTIKFISDNLTSNKKNSNETSTILDIGCGEGTYFPFFSDLGYDCYGFEPSKKNILAKKNNPSAIISSSYFENHADNIFNIQFNVVLLNWVLEHVLELENFFTVLKTYCKQGTKIIFQVPDLLYYVEHDLYLFYVHEHIHYFTPFSLNQCLNRFGFRLLTYKNADCPSLLICAEYTGATIESSFSNEIDQSINSIDNFIFRGKELGESANKIFNKYHEVFFYGAGTATYWLGEFYLKNDIKKKVRIIDDNEFYFNKYVPSFECLITKLDEVKLVNKAVFFIGTSPVYHKMIINKLTENVIGDYDIIIIENNKFNVINNNTINK